MRNQEGYTIIELLTVLAITSLLAAIAAPQYGTLLLTLRREEAKNTVRSLISDARRAAIVNGARTTVSTDAQHRMITVGIDYAPYSDSATPDSVVTSIQLPERTLLFLSQTLIFSPRGNLILPTQLLTSAQLSLSSDRGTEYAGTVFPTGMVDP